MKNMNAPMLPEPRRQPTNRQVQQLITTMIKCWIVPTSYDLMLCLGVVQALQFFLSSWCPSVVTGNQICMFEMSQNNYGFVVGGVTNEGPCLLYQAVTCVLPLSPYQLKGLRLGSIIREATCPRDSTHYSPAAAYGLSGSSSI